MMLQGKLNWCVFGVLGLGDGGGAASNKEMGRLVGCLDGAVGSTKCPSKTSERALKVCVSVSVCMPVCVCVCKHYLTQFMLKHIFQR